MPSQESTITLVSANPDYPGSSNNSTVKTTLNWNFDPRFELMKSVVFPVTDGNTLFNCVEIETPEVTVDANQIATVHRTYRFSSIGVGQA